MSLSSRIVLIKKQIIAFNHSLSLVLLFLTALLVLFPYTQAGFIGDDAQLSTQKGLLSMGDLSLQSYTYDGLINWMMNGRLFPITILASVAQWQFIQTPLAYHLLATTFILFALGLLYRLIKTQTNRESVAQLALLFTLSCFQARDYHDPILSYHPLMDLVAVSLLLSFLFFGYFLKSSSPTALRRSLGCFLITILSYEIGVPFAIVFVFLAWLIRPQDRSSIIKSLGFLLLSFLYLLVSFLLRKEAPSVYNGIGFGTVHDYFAAFVYQTTSVIPLISFFAPGAWKTFMGTTPPSLFQLLIALATGSCGALCLFQILKWRSIEEKSSVPLSNFIIPLSFLFLPPAILAMSGKYQYELHWGVGYLPVYLQSFGFGYLLSLLLQKKPFPLSKIAPLLFGFILGVTSLSNSRIVEHKNIYWKDRRQIIEAALQNNFFQNIPEKSTLYIVNQALWDVPGFYFQHGKIRVKCKDWKEIDQNSTIPYYRLHYQIINSNTKEGEVVLEKFNKIDQNTTVSELKRFTYQIVK